MARGALASVLSLGFPAVFGVFSFAACFSDMTSDKGKCQPPAMPVDTCTVYKCKADGTPAPEPVPNAENKVCFRGENEGVCVDGACALACETQGTPCKCASDTECPVDKQCLDWACDMGQCKSTQTMNGTIVDTLEMFDCKSVECQNGIPQTVADTADFNPMDDMLGDCKKPACNGDTPGLAPNVIDVPPNTGCTTNSCSAAGEIQSTKSPIGTDCGTGFCDATGMCVDCLKRGDWDSCGQEACAAKLCPKEPCDMKNGSVCQSGFCVDTFCCDTVCTDECKSCGLSATPGVCSFIPYLDPDNSYTDPVFMTPNVTCDMTNRCNGTGKCLKLIGQSCNIDTDCMSGKCATMAKACLGAKDESCSNNAQCASTMCVGGKCT